MLIKKSGLQIFLWIITILIFILLIYWLGIFEVVSEIQKADLVYLTIAVFLTTVAFLIRAVKWIVALKNFMHFKEILEAFVISKVFGMIAPARLGELTPLLLKKFRKKEVSGIIIFDRVAESYATLFLGFIGILILQAFNLEIILLLISMIIIISIILLLLLYTKIWTRLNEKFKDRKILRKIITILEKISIGVNLLKKKFSLIIFLSFVATIIDFLIVKIVFLSLGADVNFWIIAVMWAVSALATLVGITPSGLGVADAINAFILYFYDFSEGLIGAGLIMTRIIFIFVQLAISLLILKSICKHQKFQKLNEVKQ